MESMELKEYLNLDYAIVLQRDEEGDWVATINELEGCVADGPTPDEAIRNLRSMQELWIKSRLRSKRSIPLPAKEQETFSGKYLQRVPKNLHRKLVAAAEREGVSLNHFTTAVLAEAVGAEIAKLGKSASVTLVAVTSEDRRFVGSEGSRGGWLGSLNASLDKTRCKRSLRSLVRKAPKDAVIPIGREPQHDDQEDHQTWNA